MSTPTSSAATCRRLRTTPMSKILREANAGELPALVGVEEIAVGGAAMAARGRAAAAAQHELAAHQLAIIFAARAQRGAENGIGAVGTDGNVRTWPKLAHNSHGKGPGGGERRGIDSVGRGRRNGGRRRGNGRSGSRSCRRAARIGRS